MASVIKETLYLLLKIGVIAFVFIIIFTVLFGLVRYEDTSMVPSIKDGDLVIYHQYKAEGYETRDVIVLEYGGAKQIRRVVAMAGDVVDITEEGLLINGALQQEQDIYQVTERYIEGIDFPLTVPEGNIFVLGDNRTDVTDSRIYGPVEIEDTFGKVMTIIRRRGI